MEGIKVIAVILVCVVHSLCSPINIHASKENIVIQEHGDQLSDGDPILDHNDEGDHGDDLNIHDIDVMPGGISEHPQIGGDLGTARKKRNAAGNDVNIHEEDIDLSLDDDVDLSHDADANAGHLPVRRKRNAAPLTEDQLSDDDTILDHIEKVNKDNDVNMYEEDIDLSPDDGVDSNDGDVDTGLLPVRRKRNAAPLTEDQLSDDDTILDHIEKVNKDNDVNMYEEDIDLSPDDGVDSNDGDVDAGQLLGRRKRNVARDWK